MASMKALIGSNVVRWTTTSGAVAAGRLQTGTRGVLRGLGLLGKYRGERVPIRVEDKEAGSCRTAAGGRSLHGTSRRILERQTVGPIWGGEDVGSLSRGGMVWGCRGLHEEERVWSVVTAGGSRGMSTQRAPSAPASPPSGKKNVMPGMVPEKFGRKQYDESGLTVEKSAVVANPQTGEKLTVDEYSKIKAWTVLRVLEDGSREEMLLSECVEEAEEDDLTVVIVAMKAKPPVVKLMDYGKLVKDKNRKAKVQKKAQSTTTIKELRIGLSIGQHDLEVKLRQIHEFLEKGYKVKLFSRLRGAEFHNKQKEAMGKLTEIAVKMADISVVETEVAMTGNIAGLILKPEKKKQTKPSKPATGTPKAGDGDAKANQQPAALGVSNVAAPAADVQKGAVRVEKKIALQEGR